MNIEGPNVQEMLKKPHLHEDGSYREAKEHEHSHEYPKAIDRDDPAKGNYTSIEHESELTGKPVEVLAQEQEARKESERTGVPLAKPADNQPSDSSKKSKKADKQEVQ